MADTEISALPTAQTLTGSEVVPVDQSGTTKQTTTGAIAALSVAPVLSVLGRTGAVVAASGDYTFA